MARSKTQNVPDLSTLLAPGNQVTLAVERALLRGHEWAHASAPVAEQIAARLAGAITLNLVKPGQRLLENDISQVLHVSRAPVREALRILERDHLVEFQARRGAIVTAPDAKEMRDIWTVRQTLYMVLLRQLMQDRPADLEALLAASIPEMARAAESSVDAYAVESFLLNLAVADLGSNRLVADLLKSISLRTLRFVRIGLAAGERDPTAWMRSWRALQRAVAKRDVDLVLETAASRITGIRDAAIAAAGAAAGGSPAAAGENGTAAAPAARAKAAKATKAPAAAPRRPAGRT